MILHFGRKVFWSQSLLYNIGHYLVQQLYTNTYVSGNGALNYLIYGTQSKKMLYWKTYT
jgi:hypothetical protein